MKMIKGTTIICVKKNNCVALGGDGQVTLGHTILKSNARKVRFLFKNKILAGFAGSTADSFTLFEKFEEKLESFHGNISRAAIEFGKYWRSDRMLRKLDALLIVTDINKSFLLSGNGDVIEPETNIISIGSGGQYAQAAAIALSNHTNQTAKEIVKNSLYIASSICIYSNTNLIIEELK
ncbi:MAG TPA: ATP-dependent protease subunit HslV [Candidatus Azoamicus sp. MARI]